MPTGKEVIFSSIIRTCAEQRSRGAEGAEGGEALCTTPLWLHVLWWPRCCKSKSRSFFSLVSSLQHFQTALTKGDYNTFYGPFKKLLPTQRQIFICPTSTEGKSPFSDADALTFLWNNTFKLYINDLVSVPFSWLMFSLLSTHALLKKKQIKASSLTGDSHKDSTFQKMHASIQEPDWPAAVLLGWQEWILMELLWH